MPVNQETQLSFHVLIAAAGRGTRLGETTPKQYISLNEKTILEHTLEKFFECDGLKSIRVIIDPQDADLYHAATSDLDLKDFVAGGRTRKESIFNGLNVFSDVKDDEIIVIHDAARPFVTQQEILDAVSAAHQYKAASLATPVSDTLIDNNNNYPDRATLKALQTPQAFQYKEILEAHKKADMNTSYTDDTSLVAASGIPIHYVEGSRQNFKITTREDLIMAKKIMMADYTDIRTGQGFDVHAFDTNTQGPLRIGGIDIPHDHKLKGHSDADVALHTITDAILGAIGKGDIGTHFPPSDNAYKNMDSAIFLEKTMAILSAENAILKNIDLTIICEAPKIGPYAEKMKQRIAEITKCDPSHINVKATTTEKLGFTGRGEGIAAQAIATIGKKP